MPDDRLERVARIRAELLRDFEPLLDLSDVTTRDPHIRGQILLSRALAAVAVRRLTGVSDLHAARSVVDGGEGCGLDALAAVTDDRQLYLVQAKWSDTGTAGLGEVAAVRLIDALNKIRKRRFTRFNTRVQGMARRIAELLDHEETEVTLVLAVLGDRGVHPRVRMEFADAREDLAAEGIRLRCRLIALDKLHEEVFAPTRVPQICISAHADTSFRSDGPGYTAYSTHVSARQIVAWHNRYGSRLLHLGLAAAHRASAPRVSSPPDDVSHLLHPTDGLTLLCDEIEIVGATNRPASLS